MQQKSRAFLKWAGGKYSLVEDINARLNQASKHADTLVEPFVGAGSVFLTATLNTMYSTILMLI